MFKIKKHERRAGQRRRQITQVAIDLFARPGFDGTTTRRIADQAGVSEVIILPLPAYRRLILEDSGRQSAIKPSRTEGLEKRLETNGHDCQAQLFPPQALEKLAAIMVLEPRSV